jgi:hypothetical protein
MLIMGIDETGPVKPSNSYNNKGEADMVSVVIFDEKNQRIDVIALNRDTMVTMPALGLGGKQAGTAFGQLALSHTYGTGMEDSCENTRKTVSDLLYGVSIDYYIALNMDAISILNDQVGGVTGGIKYISSLPGLDQQLKVQKVAISPETMARLQQRFALIYTGQRRLARNLLRDVVGNYIGGNPDSLYALNEIQRVAALMRFELERGNIDAFAQLLNYHWELSQKVDAGSSNTLIDQIFASVEDLIDGKMICGAGGGGFLQVILKEGVTKAAVHERLKEVFEDNEVDVWNCTFVD